MERKTFLRGALGAAALSIAGCNKNDKRRIAVVPKGRAHLFWQSVHAGAVKAGREHNLDIVWNGPATETDYNGQIQIVDAMINQRVDAIALAPIDKTVMVSVVERAGKENIPVVIFDSGIDTENYLSMVATDNYAAGQLAASRMGEILGGKGKVVIVAVQPGGASTMAREQGFEDGIKKFAGIQIVDKRYGMADFAKSLQVAENMLTAFPDAAGLFASNESSAVGAAQALKGRKSSTVKMVGFDWSPTLLADLRAGLIDSLVVQDPFKMGYESVIAAVSKLDGKPVDKSRPMPPRLVTKANIDSPEIKSQLEPDLKKYLD
ncbi:MAG TPA: substrate-binding domain-containing protein [Bryobacteraceae bacterium]|nr:substrate-binding domain-containing protein [Bryobacteraceae bacterium]